MRVAFARRTLKLRAPWQTSYDRLFQRELIELALTDDDGVTGRGEAAPLEHYDGVSLSRVSRALETYRDVLEQPGEHPGAGLLDACRSVDDLPQALAAVDLALWDLAGRRAGRSVAELLTDRPAASVVVNATLSGTDRASAAAEAARAAEQGYSCVKLKVGVGDDAGRVAAVRAAAGPAMALRLDANGAWDVEQAVRTIEALAPAGLELVEEPCHGLARVRAVRERVAVRVAIDETAAEPGALGAGVADAVCLKISRCGGIGGLVAAAALVRAAGGEIYLASTLDGPLGTAAALQAAAALAGHGSLAACGLATLGMFEDTGAILPVTGGRIALPSAPGLGLDGG